jgi:UDP-N-acetylglucosamine 2-epimerase (non-hydrolysing)
MGDKAIKVITVIGTRPEIIKLSRVIAVLDECCDHVLVHTGQNYDYELNEIFFAELGVRKPDYFLDVVGDTLARTVGNVIAKSDEVLSKEAPDAILILGDTNSALAAYPAKRRKIPIFHMEAGNRCFDFRVPEEINRRIVDHISDINLPYTEHARRYLLNEGLPPDQVIKTGSPQREILDYHMDEIKKSDVLTRFELDQKKYFTVSIHREENVDNHVNLRKLVEALNKVAENYDMPLIFSCHPRTRKQLEAAGYTLDKKIRQIPPLGFFDYNHLQMHSYCTISDSGTITEESSIMGFPAITVRQAHERPEGMDEGVIIMTGFNPQHILNSIEVAVKQCQVFGPARIPQDYDVNQLSWKIVKIIFSYVDFVNRKVWRKSE